MGVVAEGLETQAQLDELVELGCDRAQGFFLAPAGPPELIEERVLHRPPLGQAASESNLRVMNGS